ncbi:MAG: hypothetical protein H6821_03615 [Planctomycetaceae bacterium]|nr:hypothetical protein [Planctomycetales bacterium]MCB9873244.1 hypothetical protein [Planctomycetaceae bacterium]MCB9939457.1 hypothetical protein [Planctomycetaceae bacterium]
MTKEETIKALLGDEKTDIGAILAGEGEWFSHIDDTVTENWGELPDEAKAIAYLRGVRKQELKDESMELHERVDRLS